MKDDTHDLSDYALWQKLCTEVKPLLQDRHAEDSDATAIFSTENAHIAATQPTVPRDRLFPNVSVQDIQAKDLLAPQSKNWRQKRTAVVQQQMPKVFAELDGRRVQRFRSGKLKPDAVLDMHGMTEVEAAESFARFFARALQRKQRNLLVITGKGSGVLHRALAGWLEKTNIRPYLAGVSAMPQHKGGSGAFGLYLRH